MPGKKALRYETEAAADRAISRTPANKAYGCAPDRDFLVKMYLPVVALLDKGVSKLEKGVDSFEEGVKLNGEFSDGKVMARVLAVDSMGLIAAEKYAGIRHDVKTVVHQMSAANGHGSKNG